MEHEHVGRGIHDPEGKWTDGIKHSMKETNHEREARCGSGRSEIASNWEGQVPADDPIQRLKSGSGWGTRDPLIRRSKSKRFLQFPGSAIALWQTKTRCTILRTSDDDNLAPITITTTLNLRHLPRLNPGGRSLEL